LLLQVEAAFAPQPGRVPEHSRLVLISWQDQGKQEGERGNKKQAVNWLLQLSNSVVHFDFLYS
jgi:hypothetical protein